MIQQQAHPPFCPAFVRWYMGGLLFTTMLLLVACDGTQARVPATQMTDTQPDAVIQLTPAIQATAIMDVYEQYGDPTLIAQLEESLHDPAWSADERQRIAAGLDYQKRQAEHRATVVAQPRLLQRRGEPAPTLTARPTATPGIFPVRFWTDVLYQYTFNTGWRDYEADGQRTLYAGFFNEDPSQGVVVELQNLRDQNAPQIARYDTPTRSGSVRIIAEENWQLTLEAENGDLFVFDVEAHAFVDDPPAPTPSSRHHPDS